MTDDFDPYYKWLAIPPTEQPPNHYRLLGAPLFTADPDVIENAADQRMTHLRSLQTGRYAQTSQRLLNEVAAARVTLLNLDQKAAYDAALRRDLPPQVGLSLPTVAAAVPGNLAAPSIHSRPGKPRASKSLGLELFKHLGGSAAGLLIGYLIAGFFAPGWDHLGLFHDRPSPKNQTLNNPLPDQPSNSSPILKSEQLEPAPIEPAPKPDVEPPPRTTYTPPVVKPMPEVAVAPPPTPEELARQAEEAKQQRLAQLQTEQDAAIVAGKVALALKLNAELAQLGGYNPHAEKIRVFSELRKVELTPAETLALVSAMLELAHETLGSDKSLATEQATAALQLARNANDQALVVQATKLILEIESSRK